MKTILLALALSCAGLVAADLAVTDGMSNGRAWTGLGGKDQKLAVQFKFLYLVGLSDGFHQTQGEIEPEKAKNATPNLLPIGADLAIMIAALDEFYSDGQNLDIPIPMAARWEKARIEGRDTEEQVKSLKRLRTLYEISKKLDSLEGK